MLIPCYHLLCEGQQKGAGYLGPPAGEGENEVVIGSVVLECSDERGPYATSVHTASWPPARLPDTMQAAHTSLTAQCACKQQAHRRLECLTGSTRSRRRRKKVARSDSCLARAGSGRIR